MTVPSYTEEDVRLVTASLPVDPDDDTTVIGYNPDDGVPVWGAPEPLARAILDDLASRGRLVPPGSERELQVGCRTWFVDDPDSAVVDWTGRRLAEIRARHHAEALGYNPAWRGRAEIVQREQITTPWSPSVPDTKEGS